MTLTATVDSIIGKVNTATGHIASLANPHSVTKTQVGLSNVDNTSDANKPISTATQTALDLKANQTTTYTKLEVDAAIVGLVDSAPAALNTLNELAAALGDDANFSTTVTNSIATKAPLNSPTFTGTVSGVTKTMVGLGSVDNTSDANKPISTATQTALNLKQNSSTAVTKDSDTGVAYLPNGTTLERPILANGAVGIRYNTTDSVSEVGVGTAGATIWTLVGGGSTGGADTVFVETSYTVTQDYTITAGKSAITVGNASGNVTIPDGITITIPDNSSWVILGA